MTENTGTRQPTHNMQTRSASASTANDDKSPPAATEVPSNESQSTTGPDIGTSAQPTSSSQHGNMEPPVSGTAASTSDQPVIVGPSTTVVSEKMTNTDVVSWINANYESKNNANVPRSGIYEHYQHYCSLQHLVPVNPATFGKMIRVAFPRIITRRLGVRGSSKYQYCNIQRRETSENANTPVITQANISATVPTHGPIQQDSRDLTSTSHTEPSTSVGINGNAGTVLPTTILPYQGSEFTSLSSQGHPSLQLPSPFSSMSMPAPSSNSPNYLSNTELVSIFSPQPTTSLQQEMGTSISSRSLISSSATVPPVTFFNTPDPQGTAAPIDQFATFYNKHCQDIYNTIRAGEFLKLQPIYDEFYQKLPGAYKSMVNTTPELTEYIWRWDCNLYDSLINDIFPKINAPIPVNIENGLENYTKNLPEYLHHVLQDYPSELRNKKHDVACVFVAKMRRHLVLNQFAVKAEKILSQPIRLAEMRRDWQTLELQTILDHVLWICDCQNDDMIKILKTDIPHLLISNINFDQLMDWVDALIEKFIPLFPKIQQNTPDDEAFVKDAKKFILNWRMYTSLIMHQLYQTKVSTLELFRELHFLFDNLVLYCVEERIASVHAHTIQRLNLIGAPLV